MIALLVGCGLPKEPKARGERVLHAAASVLGESDNTDIQFTPLPEVDGYVALARPKSSGPFPLVSLSLTEPLAVVVYGEVYPVRHVETAADCIERIYRAEGSRGVHELEGNFSAVIIDRRARQLTLVSDKLGRRAVRFSCTREGLWISNSDVCLGSVTAEPHQPDLTSLASLCGLDWSVGARSLLHGIESLRPFEERTFIINESGPVEQPHRPLPVPGSKERHDLSQETELERLRERAAATLGEFFDSIWDRKLDVRVALSAGLDSRAAFAAIHRRIPKGKLRLFTKGEDNDVEVRTARRIAALYGYAHEVTSARGSTDHFEATLTRLAFHKNGDSDAKRCFTSTSEPHTSELSIGGEYGEITRGYYYNGSRGLYENTDVAWARELLRAKFKRRKRYPPDDPAIAFALTGRLNTELDRYRAWSENGHDILDYFYLYERSANWAPGSRLPQDQFRYGLFGLPSIADIAFRFPAPIGHNARIQTFLLKTHLPETRLIPINAIDWVDTIDLPVAPYLGAAFRRLSPKLSNLKSRFGLPTSTLSQVPDAQSEMMAHLLEEGRHTFTEDSISATLLGKNQLTRLLSEHQRQGGHQTILGPLWTAERFFQLVGQVRQALAGV